MHRRAIAVMLLAALFMVEGFAGIGTTTVGEPERQAIIETVEDPGPWTDPLDDLSGVYMPPGGLVGVSVGGGQAGLSGSATEGWIASEVITCPAGNRYDLVVIDAEIPGGSQVRISVLDATAEASEVGYANATIGGLKDVEGTAVSLRGINPSTYPKIRIQVNLMASGTARPAMRAWSVYYSGLDEWREDFVSQLRMETLRGLVLADGGTELDLANMVTEPTGSGSDTLYPAVFFNRYEAGATEEIDVFYPNFDLTGYEDKAQIGCNGTRGLAMGDLDSDGLLDLVCANLYTSSSNPDSQIYWGQSDGTWSKAHSTDLKAVRALTAAVGDLDGDGELDIVFACNHVSLTTSSVVFLNQGGGSFNHQPDITFTDEEYYKVAVGDLNNDGYDDVVFADTYDVIVYFGGPNGPDKTVDIEWDSSNAYYIYDLEVADFDGDGHVDVAIVNTDASEKTHIYSGGANGPDTTADHTFTMSSNSRAFSLAHGDMNGDGYTDLAYMNAGGSASYEMRIYTGSSTGWSDSSPHKFNLGYYVYASRITDVNLDGYGDLIVGQSNEMRVYYGGETLPSSPDITMTGLYYPQCIAVAAGGKGSTRKYAGRLLTGEIKLPPGREWDTLALEAETPANTSISLTVRDGSNSPIAGLDDITSKDADLSGLSASSIKVEIWLESDLNDTTPRLDLLRVKWRDPKTWREQFYGPAKAERMMGTAIVDGRLAALPGTSSPDIVFACLEGTDEAPPTSTVMVDTGGLSYHAPSSITFPVGTASAVSSGDVDGDGHADLAFACYRSSEVDYSASSPLYRGTPVGWAPGAVHSFPTTGARDVLLRDLNGDGHADVVFAQERDHETHLVNSTLFWGSDDGWGDQPDVEFVTRGATGVTSADLDGDGDLDLAFACYKDTSTATDSMVFLQAGSTFNGSVADHRLPTRGARAVEAADLDGDGATDLVFANSFHGGFAQIDSYIYRGLAGGGFATTPTPLPTSGAEDVAVSDLDGDGDLDLVFANHQDNAQSNDVDSYIYLRGPSGYPSSPSARLGTVGATAVAVGDLDGTGRTDLAFACLHDGEDPTVPSQVFLGGGAGWSSQADLELPTVGASDVLVASLVKADEAGYISKAITPADPEDTGTFHTLTYTAHLSGARKGTVSIVDSETWEPLASTPLQEGTQNWVVEDALTFRDHPSVRVLVAATDLDRGGEVWVDNLRLNWTTRVRLPPKVVSVTADDAKVHRTQGTLLHIEVSDEYTLVERLKPVVEHRVEGTEAWATGLFGTMALAEDGRWSVPFNAGPKVQLGVYEFRVNVTDSDGLHSGYFIDGPTVEVLNMLPSTPEVRIVPGRPVTTATLHVEVVQGATDPENFPITYTYQWFRDGQPVEGLTEESVPSHHTARGENWSVEVRAWDGDDVGLPATAWRVIQNAAPMPKDPLPDPSIDEDTTDSEWICLVHAFVDADGDPMTWSVDPMPVHLAVAIDHDTGMVSLEPEEDWNGEEEVTFVASDGELSASQTVTVTVNPVNDAPRFITVDGTPIDTTPVEYTIAQGQVLSIVPGVVDVEDDELVFDTNSTAVQVDGVTGEVRFEPDNDAVGTVRFALMVWDVVSPQTKVRLDMVVRVENENDPMEEPRITGPGDGDEKKVNRSFSLTCLCYDPDTPFGQVLNYTWTSSVSGVMGHGSTLITALHELGEHVITVTVTDGEFQRTDSVTITVLPNENDGPPLDPGNDDGPVRQSPGGRSLGIMVALVLVVSVVGAASGFIVVARRKGGDVTPPDEEPEMDQREALRQMAAMVGEAADTLEESKNGTYDGDGEEAQTVWVEEGEEDDISVASLQVPDASLSMEATVTGEASTDVRSLWDDIDQNGFHASEEDSEQLRLDNLKRRYHNAIGQLPYGIPAKGLKDRDWNDLAATLATGEKKTVEGDREVTRIDDGWYYSDIDDPANFLREHGERPSANAPSQGSVDHGELLAKLEERFILGEISEEAYKELKQKYGR